MKHKVKAHADTYGPDKNTDAIQTWLDKGIEHRGQLRVWLDSNGHEAVGITNMLLAKEYVSLRKQLADKTDGAFK